MADIGVFLLLAALVGVFATAVLDLWALMLQRVFAIPMTNWAMVGRWASYLPRSLKLSQPVGQMPGQLA